MVDATLRARLGVEAAETRLGSAGTDHDQSAGPARRGPAPPERGQPGASTAFQPTHRRAAAPVENREILRLVKDPHHGRFDLWEIAV
jgi:hypothetical protein